MFYINIFCINNFFGVWQKDRGLIILYNRDLIVIAGKYKDNITKVLGNITAAEVHIIH